MLTGAVLVLLWPVVTHAVNIWAANPDLNFGFLIPPVALGLIWWRHSALAQLRARGATSALPLMLFAVASLLVSERLWANSPAAISAGLLVFGLVAYLRGWPTARAVLFPIALVTISLTLEPTLLSGVGFALQGLTALGAAALATDLGVSLVREGLVLRSANFAFVVSEACSGMNSLMALLTLATLLIYITRGKFLARGALIGAVLPLVLAANITRVTLVLLIANWFGEDAALGFFHEASSLVLFSMALAGLLLVSRLVRCQVRLAF
jgi:exosortase